MDGLFGTHTPTTHDRETAKHEGTNNAGSLNGNTCVDSKIAAYFATGSLLVRLPGRQADV